MTKAEIMKYVDHTLLSQTATEADIKVVCTDAIKFGCASICIPNIHLRFAAEYVAGRVKVGTVIGFPLGYNCTEVKCFEAKHMLACGADEFDMVADICRIKEGRYDKVLDEIKAVKDVVGNHVLKVIVEACLLTEEEKIRMCHLISESGADYIKTSTGFSSGGATREDIATFAANVSGGLKIKAAGGIRSFSDAEDFIRLGALRLGTSALVKIMKKEELSAY